MSKKSSLPMKRIKVVATEVKDSEDEANDESDKVTVHGKIFLQ